MLLQGGEGEARTEPPYMFRPVQNPDDEEVEGRVRTRTRTKELVRRPFLVCSIHYQSVQSVILIFGSLSDLPPSG